MLFLKKIDWDFFYCQFTITRKYEIVIEEAEWNSFFLCKFYWLCVQFQLNNWLLMDWRNDRLITSSKCPSLLCLFLKQSPSDSGKRFIHYSVFSHCHRLLKIDRQSSFFTKSPQMSGRSLSGTNTHWSFPSWSSWHRIMALLYLHFMASEQRAVFIIYSSAVFVYKVLRSTPDDRWMAEDRFHSSAVSVEYPGLHWPCITPVHGLLVLCPFA